MKKVYNAPYLKVVAIKNDVIATSDPTSTNGFEEGDGLIQGRHGMWDDEFDAEDVY